MPKIIELTIELEIQKVSCPGVWLCQDGRVSLSVFALGTSYQTCLLPPNFPLMFKDVFYFRKRFQESCALNNICCLLMPYNIVNSSVRSYNLYDGNNGCKINTSHSERRPMTAWVPSDYQFRRNNKKDETIYCELIQWCEDCSTEQCVILAQYLGSLNDVLFPPNMCSTDGVDLLMRRSKEFPGILAPKIEIATKVRIDEVWNHPSHLLSAVKIKTCRCTPHPDVDSCRQKQVCHSAQYHRNKCSSHRRPPSMARSRSRSRSTGTRSCCSLDRDPGLTANCRCPNPAAPPCPPAARARSPRRRPRRQYCVYSADTAAAAVWRGARSDRDTSHTEDMRSSADTENAPELQPTEDRIQKLLLESRYIEHENDSIKLQNSGKKYDMRITPCVCEICKRYHELFHNNVGESS